MTRSVEIPEAAISKGVTALAEAWPTSNDATVLVRAVLAAALPYLAPAGDGGLREALEEACKVAEIRGRLKVPVLGLRALLTAHPAAPAVPQPVDREALTDLAAYCRDRSEPFDNNLEPEDAYADIADKLDALLAGEQEPGLTRVVRSENAKAPHPA